MNRSNAVTTAIIIASVVIAYLLSQSDVAISPVAKVILTGLNLGLVTYARLSGTTPVPEKPLGTAVQTPAGETATVTKADG